jgi:hypothetical protein
MIEARSDAEPPFHSDRIAGESLTPTRYLIRIKANRRTHNDQPLSTRPARAVTVLLRFFSTREKILMQLCRFSAKPQDDSRSHLR